MKEDIIRLKKRLEQKEEARLKLHEKASRLKTKLKKVRKDLDDAEAKNGDLQFRLDVIENKH